MKRLADLRHVGRAGKRQARAEIDFLDDARVLLFRRVAWPQGERLEYRRAAPAELA